MQARQAEAAGAGSGPYYAITAIGPPAESIDVNDINNSGVAVGTIVEQTSPSLIMRAFIHDDSMAAGTVNQLSLPEPNQAVGLDINEEGMVAGTLVTTHWNDWTEYGYRILPGHPVEVLTPAVFYAAAINDRGQVAGYGYGPQGPSWRTTGNMLQSLARVAGPQYADWAVPTGIGPGGEVVGYNILNGGGLRAFLYRDATGMIDLNTIGSHADWTFEYATGTNGRHVIGWGTRNGESAQGFRLDTVTGEVLHLGAGWPRDVNAFGDTVSDALFYSDDTGLVLFSGRLDPAAGDWSNMRALGLNDRREVVGSGTLNGQRRGFKLRLPDPRACPPPADACHGTGLRDPGTGVCAYPVATHGIACDDGDPATQGDICRSAGTCSGDRLMLSVARVVDTGDGRLVAVFGYDNQSDGSIRPEVNQVRVNGALVSPPPAPVPVLLPRGVQPGAYLPSFAAGETVAWTVDGQTVTASESSPRLTAIPIDDTSYQVVVDGRTLTVTAPAAGPGSPTEAPDRIKPLLQLAAKVASFYSYAKVVIDIATFLGPVFGLWKTHEAEVRDSFNQVYADLRFLDWKVTENFIQENYNPLLEAFRSYDRTGTPSSESDNRLEATHLDNLRGLQNFCRIANDAATEGEWKRYVIAPHVPRDCMGGVYDWRRALPVLMMAGAMRVVLIGTQDPQFRASHSYGPELTDLRDALREHYDRILGGIYCSGGYCAEIYSGTFASSSLSGVSASHAALAGLMQKLPLFELRSMIDTLTQYLGDAKDLTDQDGLLPADAAPHLCVEATDQSQPGAPTRLMPCRPGGAQEWVYDRVVGTIRNKETDWCLEVAQGAAIVPGRTGLDPLTAPSVLTNWCNDANSQRWTYDQQQHVLRGALGTVLDFDTVSFRVESRLLGKHLTLYLPGHVASLMGWLDAEAPAGQRWRADQPLDFQVSSPAASCGVLGPSEGLNPGDRLLSCDGRLSFGLSANGPIGLGHALSLPPFPPPPPPPQPIMFPLEGALWATETRNIPPGVLKMQGDGNLVLYNWAGAPIWSSNTWNHPGASLFLEDGGAMMIRDQDQSILWRVGPERQYREHRPSASLLWHNSTSGEMTAWLVDDHGTVTDNRTLSARCDSLSGCATGSRLVALADFSGDDVKDLLWYHDATGTLETWVLGRTGAVDHTQALSWRCEAGICYHPLLESWRVVGALDANHDGHVDLLWQRHAELSAWLLQPDGTVTESQTLPARPTPANWKVMSTIDVDDDGGDEILVAHQGTLDDPGRLATWSPDAPAGLTPLGPLSCANAACVHWTLVGTGDFSGDALDDLLWYNEQTGELSAWILDGHGTTTRTQSLSMRCDPASNCAAIWKLVGLVNLR